MTIEVTPSALDWLAEQGYQPEFGARPLRRTVQRQLDDRLSNMLLDGRLLPGQHVVVDVRDSALQLDVQDAPAAYPDDSGAAARPTRPSRSGRA